MANKYIQNRGYADVFTGRSIGEARVNLTAKKIEDEEQFIKEQEEALERSQKKSSFGSIGGLALGLGAGLLTGGASIGIQAAAAGGATLLGRGVGSAVAGKEKRLKQGSGSLFGKERYRKADRQIEDLRDERIESAFSSALTNAATAGIFGKLQNAKTAKGLLDSGKAYGKFTKNFLRVGGDASTSLGAYQSTQAALSLNVIPEDVLKILNY